MDFLRIRHKAKERTDRKVEGTAPAPPPGAKGLSPPRGRAAADAELRRSVEDEHSPERHPAEEGSKKDTSAPAATDPQPEPMVSEAQFLEDALASRLGGVPAQGDTRFTTWRPGASVQPAVPPGPSPATFFAPSDFAVVRPPQTAAREPFQPPPQKPVVVPSTPIKLPKDPPAQRHPLDEFFFRPDENAPDVPGYSGHTPAKPAVSNEGDVREEYITFLLGKEEYAVAIERVREVLRCPPVTEVPRAPAHVRGIVSVRGEVVAVVEPRRRLGLPEGETGPAHSRLVVVDTGDGPVGLIVDAVANVVRLKPGSIEPCPPGVGGANQEFLAGIGRDRERLFTVLDLGALLRRTPSLASRRAKEGSARVG